MFITTTFQEGSILNSSFDPEVASIIHFFIIPNKFYIFKA